MLTIKKNDNHQFVGNVIKYTILLIYKNNYKNSNSNQIQTKIDNKMIYYGYIQHNLKFAQINAHSI